MFRLISTGTNNPNLQNPPSPTPPVLFPQQDLNGAEVGSFARLFAPAAVHQSSELLTVTVEAERGTKGGGTTLDNHPDDFWGGPQRCHLLNYCS